MWRDVINCGCDTLLVYLMLKIYWLQGHIYKGCDTMERVGGDTGTVAVMVQI